MRRGAAVGSGRLRRRLAAGTAAGLLSLAASVAPAGAGEGSPLAVYLLAKGQAGIWRIDVASGDRTVLELDRWPVLISVNQATVLPDGGLVVEGTNALGRRNLFSLDPDTGELAGISGLVDPDSDVPRGEGPGLEPGATALLALPEERLLFLRAGAGPMLVDLASGDRRVLSQSVAPPAGSGFPITLPVDMVRESATTALVVDRFEGVVRVALVGGTRTLAYPTSAFVEPPYRVEPLDGGRLAHAHGLDSSNAVYVFDPATGVDEPLSALGRGEGPLPVAIVDLALAPDGNLYLYDGVPPAVLAVDPLTGDRRVVSGGEEGRGSGIELPTLLDVPRFATFSPTDRPRTPRPARRRASGASVPSPAAVETSAHHPAGR